MQSLFCLCSRARVYVSTYKMYRRYTHYIQSFNFNVIFGFQTRYIYQQRNRRDVIFFNQLLLPSTLPLNFPLFLMLSVIYAYCVCVCMRLLFCRRHSYHTIVYQQFYFVVAAAAITFLFSPHFVLSLLSTPYFAV